MPVNINAAEQADIDALATEGRVSFTEGVLAAGNPYAGGPTKVDGKPFNAVVPPGSSIDTKVLDGLKKGAVPVMHRCRPFGFHLEALGPVLSFTTATDVLSLSVAAADQTTIVRPVLATANFSAAGSVAGTRVDFWVEVDGVPTSKQRFLFGDTLHHNVGGNWMLTLPAGAASIKLRAERGAGTGNVTFTADDFAALTLWG